MKNQRKRLSKLQVLNPRRDLALYNLNCYIEFPLLNDKYTILYRDLNPPVSSYNITSQKEDCYQSTTLPPSHHGWIK